LHRARRRPCGQALHTLHHERYFTPCAHGPFVGGALFRFLPFVVDSSLRFSSASAPSIPGTAILTFGRHTVVILPSRAPQSAVDQKTGSFFCVCPLFLAGSSKRGSSFARAAGCVLARGVRGECVRAGLTCRSPAMMSRAAAIALAALCILAPGAPPSKPTAPLSPQF